MTQAYDPVIRNPEGPAEGMKSIIPGLSAELPPRLRWSGEAARRPGGFVMRGFFVPQVSREMRTELLTELERLEVFPTVSRVTFSRDGEELVTDRFDKLSVAQAIGFQRRYELERAFGRPSYARKSDEDKKDLLNAANNAGSREVRGNLLRALDRNRELTLENLMDRRAYRHVENPDADLDERQYQETP